jgi:hypothetical protein
MRRTTLIAAAVVAGITAFSASGASADADACAGQEWPYLSQDCIDQIVDTISTAGGGGSSSATAAIATGQKQLAPRVSKRQFMSYQIKRTR